MSGDTNPPDRCIILTDFLSINSVKKLSKEEIINYCKDTAEKITKNNKNSIVAGVVLYNEIEMEPFSENLFLEVVRLYNYQIRGFEEGGADFIFIKDIKSLGHLRAALIGARQRCIPPILGVFVDVDGELCNGTSLLSSLLVAQSLGAKAFVINGQDKDTLLRVFAEVLPFAKIPVFIDSAYWIDIDTCGNQVYANNIIGKSFKQERYIFWNQDKDVVKILNSNKKINRNKISSEYEFALSSAREPFLFNQMYQISNPYSSDQFFPDDFLEIQNLDFDIIQIHLTTKQYAYHIAINSYMLEKPVCFLCDDEDILETALIYYKGIALVNGDCHIPKNKVLQICKKYGAVLTMENSY